MSKTAALVGLLNVLAIAAFGTHVNGCGTGTVGSPIQTFSNPDYTVQTFDSSAGDPCSCGISIPAGFSVQNASLRGPDGTTLINFTVNAAASPLYQANFAAPSGQTWVGLSGVVMSDTSAGQQATLSFQLSGNGGSFSPLVGIGSANPDGTPNFGGAHPVTIFMSGVVSLISVPTLSQFSFLIFATLLLATGILLLRQKFALRFD